MSGVKISEAELEKMKQAELERQRQERLRKIKEATDRYSELNDRFEAFRVNVSFALNKEIQSLASVGELNSACKSFLSVKSSIGQNIIKPLSAALPIEPV